MNGLVVLLFASIFLVEYLSRDLEILPRPLALLPEVISGIILLWAVLHVGRRQAIAIHVKYVVLFVAFCLHVLLAAAINGLDPSTMLAGLRNYFKYTPLFLVGGIIGLSDTSLKRQSALLLILGLVQLPLTLVQAFVFDMSPDRVSGTLLVGSTLDVYLLGCLAVLCAFFLRGMMHVGSFAALAIALFLPITLNETKAAVILVPATFTAVLVWSSGPEMLRRRAVGVLALGASMLAGFLVVYAALFMDRIKDDQIDKGYAGIRHYSYSGIVEKVNPEAVLERDSRVVGARRAGAVTGSDEVRRIDGIVLPLRVLAHDPVRLITGLGVGNASRSIVSSFSGQYANLGGLNVSQPALALLFWEIGVGGVFLFLAFFYMILRDAYRLSRAKGLSGAFGAGWGAIVLMLVLTMPYINFLAFNVLGFLFFYFSGYVASRGLDKTCAPGARGRYCPP